MWDEITYPFPNFNGSTIEVWEWISKISLHLAAHVTIYLGLQLIHVGKTGCKGRPRFHQTRPAISMNLESIKVTFTLS